MNEQVTNPSWVKWIRVFVAVGATAGCVLTWYFAWRAWKK